MSVIGEKSVKFDVNFKNALLIINELRSFFKHPQVWSSRLISAKGNVFHSLLFFHKVMSKSAKGQLDIGFLHKRPTREKVWIIVICIWKTLKKQPIGRAQTVSLGFSAYLRNHNKTAGCLMMVHMLPKKYAARPLEWELEISYIFSVRGCYYWHSPWFLPSKTVIFTPIFIQKRDWRRLGTMPP